MFVCFLETKKVILMIKR